MLIARCRRGSRPAVSWCVLPCIWSYCPPLLPCPALVPMPHVLPVYARPASPRAHAVMLAAPCPAVPCLPDQRRPLVLRILKPAPCSGMITITTPRLPPCSRCSVYMSTCLHVYMSTCLHVYKLPPEMAYLSAKTDKQRQTRTGAIKPRPSQSQPLVSFNRSNNSFCLPASACRFMYSVNAASSSSPLPLPFAFT